MKQVTCFLLVILSLGASFYGNTQVAIQAAPFPLNIVLSDQQKSFDLRAIQATFQKAGIDLFIEFQTRKKRDGESPTRRRSSSNRGRRRPTRRVRNTRGSRPPPR